MTRHRRLPFSPIEDAVIWETQVELAARLGIDRTQVTRWRKRGLDLYQADRLAVATGRHPTEVWPDWDRVPA